MLADYGYDVGGKLSKFHGSREFPVSKATAPKEIFNNLTVDIERIYLLPRDQDFRSLVID